MLRLFNVKTGERKVLTRPHQIAAFINSGDLHVNSNKGQDFGWRIDAEDLKRINALRADTSRLEEVARFLGKPVEDIRQMDFIKYISYLDDMAEKVKLSGEEEKPAFQAQYEAEVAAVLSGKKKESKPVIQKVAEQKPQAEAPKKSN